MGHTIPTTRQSSDSPIPSFKMARFLVPYEEIRVRAGSRNIFLARVRALADSINSAERASSSGSFVRPSQFQE
jgi:hypothetical protein